MWSAASFGWVVKLFTTRRTMFDILQHAVSHDVVRLRRSHSRPLCSCRHSVTILSVGEVVKLLNKWKSDGLWTVVGLSIIGLCKCRSRLLHDYWCTVIILDISAAVQQYAVHCASSQPMIHNSRNSYGEYSGNILLILRVPLSPTDASLLFTLCWRYFPVQSAFAIMIKKDQGQMLECVSILLDETVFSHGQLYVVASYSGNPHNV